ncbi:IS3 family transposase, partial [Neobacillus drentensis]|uniref:IS3 family transposase n=1 Tax=Neobacillus drentensis TaxID=220684 RepID=UPI003B587C0C
CISLNALKQIVDSYIEEYNNHRYQWGLNKMTPAQYEGTEKHSFFYDLCVTLKKIGNFLYEFLQEVAYFYFP